jgi:ribonucleoside-diphosphate reductase alpha chain
MAVKIDFSRDTFLTPFAIETLKEKYMIPGEESPQQAFLRAATAFADDEDHAQRLYDYASKLWFMFATPLLANGGTTRGLPASCFLTAVPDSRKGITDHYTEVAFLASVGGGIGAGWSAIRSDGTSTSSGSSSSGCIPFLKVVDSEILAFHQGRTRRGSYAEYLDISHPEIEEFLGIRKPTGGDINRKALNTHNAVSIPDSFMVAVENGDQWPLVDPHTNNTVKTISARELWTILLETRVATGEPYIFFKDAVNNNKSPHHKRLGLTIESSNLCSEIVQPCDEERTAVCCLSSVNLETYDQWKEDPQFIPDLVRMLDNAISVFISTAPEQLKKAKFAASRERSIGLGAMGFHAYLQSQGVPFEGPIASGINRTIFRNIRAQAEEETKRLAEERGSCPDAGEHETRRNIYLMAVAPNASSSIICGNTSPSIEPFRANAFTQKTNSGSSLLKNKHLEKLLEEKGENTPDTWRSIITNEGSVQHLEFLDEWEKKVFKTAMEIDQRWIIDHAASRQEYIDQAQSVNVFLPSNVNVQVLHDIHFTAWKKGLKTLYYCRSTPARRSEVVASKVEEKEIKEYSEDNECWSCQG